MIIVITLLHNTDFQNGGLLRHQRLAAPDDGGRLEDKLGGPYVAHYSVGKRGVGKGERVVGVGRGGGKRNGWFYGRLDD